MPVFIKNRKKEFEHKVLEILDKRLNLESTYKWRLKNWNQGHEGESRYDGSIIQLRSDCLAINGIYLNVDGNEYQIDTILIFPKKVVVTEIKNFEGEYEQKKGRFYRVAINYEIRDPFYQLEKNKTALRQLLYKFRLDMPVEGYLVFMNPEFTLYNAPKRADLILPTKVPAFLKELNEESGRISEQQKRVAKKIAAMHIVKRKDDKLPKFTYEELKKGITCSKCRYLMEKVCQRTVKCHSCGYQESMQQALWRMAEGLDLLRINAELVVTASQFRNYCGGLPTNYQAHSFLSQHGQPIKGHRCIQYTFADGYFGNGE